MARITVEDCLEKVENQYDLVLLAKERTSQLNSGSEMLVEEHDDKRTVVALREIAEGKVDIDELRKSTVLRLRKEPDENLEEQDTEEISSDDFEKQYKGEVSKSGVAILPSKRMRKIPTPTASTSNLEEDTKKSSRDENSPLKLTEEIEEKK